VIYILGIINIFLGGILALYQRNIKRIIAYSSLSQTGFMLMGIGLIGILGKHGGIALVGTILFMVNHAFFKLLLFMAAGLVFMILNELSLNVIRGFGTGKNKLKLVFLIGALGLSGVPGFNGFVSKTLIHDAILEAYHYTNNPFFKVSEVLFLLGGGLTIAYMLKLFIAVFVEKNVVYFGQYEEQIKKRALFPMTILAVLIVFVGIFPNSIIASLFDYANQLGLEYPHDLKIYTVQNISYFIFSLSIGILVYLLFVKRKLMINEGNNIKYLNPSMNFVHLEEDVYIPVGHFIFKVFSFAFRIIDTFLLSTIEFFSNLLKYIGEADVLIIPKLEWKRSIVDTSLLDFKDEIESKLNFNPSELSSKLKSNVSKELEVKQSKVKELILYFHERTSSITYSIFVIGAVLVLSFCYVFFVG
jgi:NADH:ubiquinone oxidoreductase subunit 5 (subunit L)/multisubunit Na+/H+ antiporter MnhA subunit